MKKAYSFRIYPNKNQEVKLNRTLNTCRHLYNNALDERKRRLSFNKDSFQKEVHSQVLQNVLKRVNKSIQNFFNGFGFPRYKGRNRYDSFTYPQSGFAVELEN